MAAAAETQSRLLEGGPLVAAFEEGAELPTQDDPQLALVLIPTDRQPRPRREQRPGRQSRRAGSGRRRRPHDRRHRRRIDGRALGLPLRPAAAARRGRQPGPRGGDRGRLGRLRRRLRAGVGGRQEVLNVNEAHAYASCSNCVAVAVAFQVVLVMDGAQVVVPQNLAVSANYDCYLCITAAIASQLVLSVPGEPGEEELLALGEVWNRILEFAAAITSYSVTEIMEQLESFKAEIVSILGEVPALEPSYSATGSPTPDEDGADPSSTATGGPHVADGGRVRRGPRRPGCRRRPRRRRRGRPPDRPRPSPTEPSSSATPSPTESPTPSPSSSPSESPSESSTGSPTPAPTESTSPMTSTATESPSASVSP